MHEYRLANVDRTAGKKNNLRVLPFFHYSLYNSCNNPYVYLLGSKFSSDAMPQELSFNMLGQLRLDNHECGVVMSVVSF
jgi:hypothetical protein